ncbi:hypothetical protein CYMTET_7556 [Cymbomonas tetramitiformis]|uniref:Uncharacterized protein n=1 Tax=Cymbomonas tetramitiformis TaxID=36881 RepID=A0AAE0GV16_9CHLO|nr:hypothetical protein CYMTET_7556 [Cymbomonas tetramitiformis]
MSGQLKAGPRGSYGQRTEKDAGMQTDITGVHPSLEDQEVWEADSYSVWFPIGRGGAFGLRDAIAEHGRTTRRRQSAADDVAGGRQESRAVPTGGDLGHQGESHSGGEAAGAGAAHQTYDEGDRPGGQAGHLDRVPATGGDDRGRLARGARGPTEDLVEVELLTSNRRVVRGEWPLGERGDRWEKLRGEAAKERRRIMAWAAAVQDMQQELRSSTHPSPNGSGSPDSTGPSPWGVLRTDDEMRRLVETALAAALEKRDAGDRGSGGKGWESSPSSLRDVSKMSMGKRLGWTWSECERVIAEVRVAAAQQADLVRVKHAFGRHPAGRVKPWAFGLVDERFPRWGQEQCGLEELPDGEKLRGRKRRAARPSRGSEDEDSDDEERKRAAAKARFGSLRTATDEELRRAMDGTLSVKDITRPSGESAVLARHILHAGGALNGMDTRVARPGGDVDEGSAEWRLDPKRGLVL